MTKSFVKKNTCFYCGEAPLNHGLSFFESMVSITIDNHAKRFIKYVPSFVKDFVDSVPKLLFNTLVFFKIAKFSKDINKANTFRSRIIWEEAKKRGIEMEQVIFLNRPLDFYRAKLNNKYFYFESIPIRPQYSDMDKNWDDKVFLKKELKKYGVPVPNNFEIFVFTFLNNNQKKEKIFSKLMKPIIIKPRMGSRARHTVTNINTVEHFKKGIAIAGKISPYLIRVGLELYDHILRQGFSIESVLPKGKYISLSHRAGQLFGGMTKEMIDELHPSFIPIFKKALDVVGLSIAGFDAIIPDPTKDEASQKWGIIECNTLPFIDMHYYALEGKPKNIAGMIWDMWR